jgi:hypothetical protein
VIRNHHGTERLSGDGDDGDVLFSRHVVRQNKIDLVCGQGLDQLFWGADRKLTEAFRDCMTFDK